MTTGMLETLKKYWGYDSFRPMQAEIISEALAGRDVLAILPTGGGKSVCFQVPALIVRQVRAPFQRFVLAEVGIDGFHVLLCLLPRFQLGG